MGVDEPRVQEVLEECFGIRELRGQQESAVAAVLEGRDLLITWPTGAGKSLVYQLPALCLEGITLVVSPLIALMKDQVDALRARGIRASFINSSLTGKQRAQRLEDAKRGLYDLLYVTPERFRRPDFLAALPSLCVTRLAVDEAHCMSQWGHDFRPDYSRLGRYRRLLGSPPTLALTATATPTVARDICQNLELVDPLILRTGIDRANLFLTIQIVQDKDEKLHALAQRIRSLEGPGIVYSALIKDLEALHDELARMGIPSLVYHGKLSPEERRSMQERFMKTKHMVVLATNAFGMGIDKADIRFVLHAQIPRTIEAWTQEIGRAGRDGQPAWCELFYLEEDLAIQQNFVDWANPSLDYLVQVFETLESWGERAMTKDLGDLREELLVKNRGDQRVSQCLRWFEVMGLTRGSLDTGDLEILSDLDPSELPEFFATGEKKKADLQSLLALLRFVKDEESCRWVGLSRWFDLEAPEPPCGHCDACVDRDSYREEQFAPRDADGTKSQAARDEEAGFHRGDWVRLSRGSLAQVKKVEGEGRSQSLLVQLAEGLQEVWVRADPRRVQRLDEKQDRPEGRQ